MRSHRSILKALLLLLAGTLLLGGPLAVHRFVSHQDAEIAVACDSTSNHNHNLPTDKPAPTKDDCPTCHLLTNLAFADTAATTALVGCEPGWTITAQAVNTSAPTADRAPRSTRGPPAA